MAALGAVAAWAAAALVGAGAYCVLVLAALRRWPREPKAGTGLGEPLCKRDRAAPRLIVHRGQLENGPGAPMENSVEAFRKCKEDGGVEMVELDVRLTKDGHVVVFHDDCLRRLFPQHSLADVLIKHLDRRQYPNGVPGLDAALEALGDLPVLIELKGDDLALVDKVKSLVDRHGCWDNVVWGSFENAQMNKCCRTAMPEVRTVLAAKEIRWLALAFVCGVLPWVPVRAGEHLWVPTSYHWVLGPMMRHLARRGLVVVACDEEEGALNDLDDCLAALSAGATSVSTDRLLFLRKENALRQLKRVGLAE